MCIRYLVEACIVNYIHDCITHKIVVNNFAFLQYIFKDDKHFVEIVYIKICMYITCLMRKIDQQK